MIQIHDARTTDDSHNTQDPKFWARFQGAYSALLATARANAQAWPATNRMRGSIKIARRDALIIAEGIAALLQKVADERLTPPAFPIPSPAELGAWTADLSSHPVPQ